jgi:hypothetical protein
MWLFIFGFFNDFSKVSCDLVTEGSYINCSDKEPEDVKSKDQDFDEAIEKVVDTSNTVSGNSNSSNSSCVNCSIYSCCFHDFEYEMYC